MSLRSILLSLLLLVAIAYLGFSLYVANKLTVSIHRPLTSSAKDISSDFQEFSTKTSDGISLKGWYFPGNNPKQVVIFVPGLNFPRTNSDYGIVEIAKDTLNAGYSVILYDPRGTGESGGDRNGFGSTEWKDILSILDFAKEKGFDAGDTALIGDSNGAITLLNSLNRFKEIGVIVADSPAAKMQTVVEKGLKDNNVPQFTFPAIFFFSKLFWGSDILSVNPIDAVENNRDRVLLLLHGDQDTVIPIENSREILNVANPESELVVFPGAEHVLTYKTNPELWRKEVFTFLSSQFK